MILSTDPAAGEPLEEGRNIQVIISSGKEKVKVPPFTNMPIDGVLSQLGTMGLEQGDITEEESDKAKGTVLEQSIPADTEVDKARRLISSSAPVLLPTRKVEVPALAPRNRLHLRPSALGSGQRPDHGLYERGERL